MVVLCEFWCAINLAYLKALGRRKGFEMWLSLVMSH